MMKRILMIAVAFGATALLSAKAADAKENFATHCVKCHGEDGKGDTKMGNKAGVKDFTDAKYMESKKDDQMAKSIKEGIKDGDKTMMKAYAELLSDDEIKALVAHVRSLKK